MLFVLETAQIIKNLILRPLTVHVISFLLIISAPVGDFELVVLALHGRGADGDFVTELADTLRGDFRGCVRIESYGGRKPGQPGNVIAERHILVGFLRREPVEKENAFLGPQLCQKGEVRFAVLDAEFPCGMVLVKTGCPDGDTVLTQQDVGDSLNILLLENAKVLPQDAAPERGLNSEAVLHLPVVVLFHAKGGNHAADTAQHLRPLPEGQGGVFFKQFFNTLAEGVACDIHLQHEGA